ncbi:type II secretion system protein [Lysinibacillus sp. SGAir0095]|uniref:type II secretion system protein n=1 Tax=Lysinibacillus sp. SGAir0095 TaxID=2070463 RepID=UPI0010CCF78A|nr:hypothetical protein [Lysinibacillus sp. SGAir0095]QCR32034.1 hypothetical protein C1N55_07555 [Lysinibacillus sp. SGAir0095]
MKINNLKGITLVEILAAIVITAFIAVTIITIVSNGRNASMHQTEKNFELMDTAYALKIITEDIRKYKFKVELAEDLGYKCSNTLNIDDVYYSLSTTGTLKKGNIVISEEIEIFEVCKENNVLTINIKTVNGVKEKTQIVIR